MEETYEEAKGRVHPELYEVARWVGGSYSETVTGPVGEMVTVSEPLVFATVRERADGRPVASGIALNTLVCRVPEGPSGLHPRGMDATDEEIILALADTESPSGRVR
jgi:hypothetical protein